MRTSQVPTRSVLPDSDVVVDASRPDVSASVVSVSPMFRRRRARRGGSPREGARSELASGAATGGGGRRLPRPGTSWGTSPMGRYVLHRLSVSLHLLLVISIIAFTFINLAPGSQHAWNSQRNPDRSSAQLPRPGCSDSGVDVGQYALFSAIAGRAAKYAVALDSTWRSHRDYGTRRQLCRRWAAGRARSAHADRLTLR